MPSAIDHSTPSSADPALEIEGLRVAYKVRRVDREVLHALSLRIERGQSYGLVGESGCGKSTVALAAMRYLPRNGRIVGGSIAAGISTAFPAANCGTCVRTTCRWSIRTPDARSIRR
jgi:ABC-type glutathione transport system ATPase component